MNSFRKSVSFLGKFTAFSVAVALAAVYIGGTVSKTASVFYPAGQTATVVAPAGHGGRDGGAVADDGTLEKELNLALSEDLRDVLSLFGIDTVMTRDSDVMLADDASEHKKRDDLQNRVKIAEQTKNCVFVSIHMNKFPVQKYSGLQVYFSPNNEESKILAECIQSAVKNNFQKDNFRGTKAGGSSIYLLENLTCPAVLVECGFLSNPGELELLKSESYRQTLAFIIAAAVAEYLSA
ncbi:MAG: N-acetylmuramoyl-L-alanine amidase [Clostridiales bacterium]|nr:N-acetylmuramoyl-L-alanine amidase [Clostridiales bacterium]